jgi:hypothetical protein
VIEYQHIRRQHIYDEAATLLNVIDVKVAANVTSGHVMGVGDRALPPSNSSGSGDHAMAPRIWRGAISRAFPRSSAGVRATSGGRTCVRTTAV